MIFLRRLIVRSFFYCMVFYGCCYGTGYINLEEIQDDREVMEKMAKSAVRASEIQHALRTKHAIPAYNLWFQYHVLPNDNTLLDLGFTRGQVSDFRRDLGKIVTHPTQTRLNLGLINDARTHIITAINHGEFLIFQENGGYRMHVTYEDNYQTNGLIQHAHKNPPNPPTPLQVKGNLRVVFDVTIAVKELFIDREALNRMGHKRWVHFLSAY